MKTRGHGVGPIVPVSERRRVKLYRKRMLEKAMPGMFKGVEIGKTKVIRATERELAFPINLG